MIKNMMTHSVVYDSIYTTTELRRLTLLKCQMKCAQSDSDDQNLDKEIQSD